MVGLGRLELPTSRLSSARSNQLSYRPAPGARRHDPEPGLSTPAGPVVPAEPAAAPFLAHWLLAPERKGYEDGAPTSVARLKVRGYRPGSGLIPDPVR